MTMQQVKINAYQVVGAARFEGTHYSNHPQLLVEGWHLGRTSSATVPCGATSRTCR
jgi:hypothetical protein